jgi:hypothetical protein
MAGVDKIDPVNSLFFRDVVLSLETSLFFAALPACSREQACE